MGIGQRGSGKWRRRERVEGEIERRGSVSWRLGLEGSAGPWAGLGRRVRWAAAGEAGWAYLSLLFLIFSLIEKQKERGKEKKG